MEVGPPGTCGPTVLACTWKEAFAATEQRVVSVCATLPLRPMPVLTVTLLAMLRPQHASNTAKVKKNQGNSILHHSFHVRFHFQSILQLMEGGQSGAPGPTAHQSVAMATGTGTSSAMTASPPMVASTVCCPTRRKLRTARDTATVSHDGNSNIDIYSLHLVLYYSDQL